MMSFRRRRPAVIAVALGCVLASALGDAAYASILRPTPTAHNASPSQPSKAASNNSGASASGGSASTKDYPPGPKGYQRQGLVVTHTVAGVRKQKVSFHYPETTSLAYITTITRKPPPPNPLSAGTIYADVYLTSPKGAAHPFGEFPVKTVKALAFGAIPVTATVHAHQVYRHGEPVPLKLTYHATFAVDKNGNYHAGKPDLRGPVSVRVGSVLVDQTPLSVGPRCHAVAELHLTAGKGVYSTAPYPKRLYIPFSSGGDLHGTLDIPTFHGCHDGAENLDPLFDGLISGNGNPLRVHQKGPLNSYPVPKSAR